MTRSGLGSMPLTLWMLVAGVVTYLYIRRSSLGIDKHPGEGKPVPVRPAPPTVVIPGPMSPGADAPAPPTVVIPGPMSPGASDPGPPTVVIPGPMSPGASDPGPPLSPFEAWLNNLLHRVPVPAPPGTIPVTGTGKGV